MNVCALCALEKAITLQYYVNSQAYYDYLQIEMAVSFVVTDGLTLVSISQNDLGLLLIIT